MHARYRSTLVGGWRVRTGVWQLWTTTDSGSLLLFFSFLCQRIILISVWLYGYRVGHCPGEGVRQQTGLCISKSWYLDSVRQEGPVSHSSHPSMPGHHGGGVSEGVARPLLCQHYRQLRVMYLHERWDGRGHYKRLLNIYSTYCIWPRDKNEFQRSSGYTLRKCFLEKLGLLSMFCVRELASE